MYSQSIHEKVTMKEEHSRVPPSLFQSNWGWRHNGLPSSPRCCWIFSWQEQHTWGLNSVWIRRQIRGRIISICGCLMCTSLWSLVTSLHYHPFPSGFRDGFMDSEWNKLSSWTSKKRKLATERNWYPRQKIKIDSFYANYFALVFMHVCWLCVLTPVQRHV